MRIYGLIVLMLFVFLMVRRIAILASTAWRLITRGRGITRHRQSAASSSHTKPGGTTAEPETPTAELPVTPSMSEAMAAEIARRWRVMKITIFSGMAFFLLIVGGVDLALPSSSGVKVFPYFGAASLAFGLFISGFWKLTARPLRLDMAGFTHLRTFGPVELVPVYGGYLLRLADRAFGLNTREVVAALRNLTWATVDYSKHAHIIFEVRDRSGRTLYSRQCTPGTK